ncbi:flagellar basal body P-ring formation chaperone FlgA [Vogesella indigofera]|uniref:flagellar basal body P-ring formation chaperone FlgA n=1 Tax=Vogesella indigofera TaxID=45465 RepID=UPI00234F35EC|nr:flagellar basal body P-ring formation chaperone FlgA [Vogesella indigofera]MDC7706122.1 flagellar basal body P-ring formation chaperone FlgA [Vogesella indigofera]
MAIFTNRPPAALRCTAGMLLLSAGSLLSPAAQAATAAELAQQSAQQWLLQQAAASGLRAPQIRLQALPARLAPGSCLGKPVAEIGSDSDSQLGRVRVRVRCQGAGEIGYLFRAEVSGLALAAANDIAPGQTLGADDVSEQRVLLRSPQPLLAPDAALDGLRSKTLIRKGTPLRTLLLETAPLVKRGMAVAIVAEQEGIRVEVAGTALETAGKDEWVRVKNGNSGKVIRARVIDTGVVSPEISQ